MSCESPISPAVDPTASPLVPQGEGIALRDWLDADLPHMPSLFDVPDMAANTDLPSPFHADAFLVRIRRRRAQGIVDLAVTRDGREPLGLVALHGAIGVPGYAIGPAHRGRGMASRSLWLLTRFCHEELGFTRLRLSIVQRNVPSQRVAASAGYVRSDDDVVERPDGLGQPKLLETWQWIAPGTFA